MNRTILPTINDRDFRQLLDRLQIGAFDGKSGDPVYRKAIDYNWSGILVEPISDYFTQLRNNYRSNPNVVFENVAISREHGSRAMFRKGNLSSTSLERNINFDTGKITEELVSCITLQSLLQRHNVHQIDLFQVDAEGKDQEIMEDFDFDTYSPAIINFEANSLSSPQRINMMLEKLRDLGYTLYNHQWDQAKHDITATTLSW